MSETFQEFFERKINLAKDELRAARLRADQLVNNAKAQADCMVAVAERELDVLESLQGIDWMSLAKVTENRR